MNRAVVDSADSYHHGDLANACVDAALALLAHGGREGVTLREVARRIGVSRSAPYRHFVDKRALLAACAARGFDQLSTAADEVLARKAVVDVDTLRVLLRRYGEFGSANPHLYRLMFACDFKSDEYPTLTQKAQRAFEALYAAVERGQREGSLGGGHTYSCVLLLWSSVHGLVSLCNDLAPSEVFDSTALTSHLDRIMDVIAPALGPVARGRRP